MIGLIWSKFSLLQALLLAMFLLSNAFVVLCQTQNSNEKAPRLIDSYNDKIQSSEAEQAHLDSIAVALQEEPKSKLFIVAYGGREDAPGKALRFVLRAKNYLSKIRGVDPKRIETADGGRREDFIVEVWLVPEGASFPKLTPNVTVEDDLGDNLLYDEFNVGYENFGNMFGGVESKFAGFAAALEKEPNSWGCIVAYANTGDDRVGIEWDAPGTALKIAQGHKNYLVKNYKVAASKLTAVDGGYSGRVVQLWVIRPNARFDKGPFIYPSRLKSNRTGVLTVNNNQDPLVTCCKACIRGKTSPIIR